MHLSSVRRFGRVITVTMLASLALTTSYSSVSAQDQEFWRCDAQNGMYREKATPVVDKFTSISGRIAFHKGYVGATYASIARIVFQDSKLDDADCRCNGIFIKAFHNPETVGFYMLADGEAVALSSRILDAPTTFQINIDTHGLMTVRVGNDKRDIKTVSLPHSERDTFKMSCSGADVSFLDIVRQ